MTTYADIVQRLNEDPTPRLKDGLAAHIKAYRETGLDYDALAIVDLVERLIQEKMRTWKGDNLLRTNK